MRGLLLLDGDEGFFWKKFFLQKEALTVVRQSQYQSPDQCHLEICKKFMGVSATGYVFFVSRNLFILVRGLKQGG